MRLNYDRVHCHVCLDSNDILEKTAWDKGMGEGCSWGRFGIRVKARVEVRVSVEIRVDISTNLYHDEICDLIMIFNIVIIIILHRSL